MTTSFFENLFEFDSLCSNISKIDDNIELVAVLNNKGRAIEMITKEDGINRESSSSEKRDAIHGICTQI